MKDCPFRYQGQYEDKETGLYYNRFRYYSAEEGMYICQDPVRLEGERCNLYGYVTNTNKHVDILEVIDYAEKKKMVTPEEAKLLSSQCKGK